MAEFEPACPLCGLTKSMRKAKPLYGALVCKKCYYGFANRRQLAYIVDAFVLWWPISFAFGFAAGVAIAVMDIDTALANWILIFMSWIGLPMVFFLKDGFGGGSPGKWLCGVQVVDRTTYEPIGFGRSWMRNLPLIIPVVPLIIAFLLQRGPRWGDGWAQTKVVWRKYRHHPLFTDRLVCGQCQYDLRGNTSGVCPECGTPIPQTAPPPALPADAAPTP